MQNIITKEFIEKFNTLNDKKVDVYIEHILYGSQKVRGCVPQTFWDGERIGLIIEGEEKYITMDELREVCADDNGCRLKSDVIEIKVNMQ
jgi:hypothetical protein